MGLLGKLFSRGDLLQQVTRAAQQGRWAEALSLGENASRAGLSPEAIEDLERILCCAGEELAGWNIREGEACIRAGDSAKAEEHLLLARQQARSEETRAKAVALLEETSPKPGSPPTQGPGCCDAGCSSPPAGSADEMTGSEGELDRETRLELLLAGYPAELARRYEQASVAFLDGFLLAHEGREEEALERFDQVAAGERDDLYYFERGSMGLRQGRVDVGLADLRQALQINHEHDMAWETLISAAIGAGLDDLALSELQNPREGAEFFRQARISYLLQRRQETERALEQARSALTFPHGDPESLQMIAAVLEEAGCYDEAEAALGRLSTGGCSGSGNLPLALFWSRRRVHLDRALEAFKGAARRDPLERRWPLEIARIYLLRGWIEEGRSILRTLLSDPALGNALRKRAEDLMTACADGKAAEIT